MQVCTYDISYKYGQIIKIKPIFDVHYGQKACDVNAFKSFLADSDESTYFIGGGDLTDNIIISDIRRYRKSQDITESDAIVDEQIEGFIGLIEPYKDKVLGLGRGNHEDTIIKYSGTDPIKRICDRLNDGQRRITYLGYSWLVRLRLREKNGRGRTFTIRGHHGWGGGSRTQGADLTKYSKDIAYWEADAFLYSHVHRKQSDRVPRLGLSGSKLVAKPQLLCLCGGFLKTYTEGPDATYAEVRGYPPTEIGGITINIKPNHNWVDTWVDI